MAATKTVPGLKEVAVGEVFRGKVIVRSTEVRYRESGEAYLVLEVGDHSGRLKGRLWQQPLKYAHILRTGQVILLEARIEIFRDIRTFRFIKLKPQEINGPDEWKALLPRGQQSYSQLKQKMLKHINRVDCPFLRKLLDVMYLKNDDQLEAFLHAPGGKLWHYNYLHGLAEQTVHLLELAETLQSCFPLLDHQLLKTGILCRASGFVEAFSLNGFIDYGNEARLSGIIPLAYLRVNQAIKKIDAFPEEQRQCVLHLVAFSCEDGTLVHPDFVSAKTPEAIALECLLHLVRNVNAVTRIVNNDIPPNSGWSKHITLLNRKIYVGERNRNPNNTEI